VTYRVRFAPEAIDQLVALRRYIAAAATPTIADNYAESIVSYCEGLGMFPHGGSAREDIRPGLRTSSFKKRVVVAYAVDDEARALTVVGLFYGGQDFESLLSAAPDDK
jgi:toxin ParE1/3/4